MKRWLPAAALVCLLALLAFWGVSFNRSSRDYEATVLIIESCLRRATACAGDAMSSPNADARRRFVAGMSGGLQPASGLVDVLAYYSRADQELAIVTAHVRTILSVEFSEPTNEELRQFVTKLETLLGVIAAARTEGRVDAGKLTRSLRNLSI